MNCNMLVSVIIPVYNTVQFLTEALDSVVSQKYKNLEIIIIDDGSTDGSAAICDEYAKRDRRIVVIHQKNKGLSAARNIGLEIMTGEAVAFLDSDDAYHTDYIEIMTDIMCQKTTDVVICGYAKQKTEGRMDYALSGKMGPSIKQGSYDRKQILQALAEGKVNHGLWNKLYKSELWKTIRFPEGHVYEEINTTYRILNLSESVYVVNRPMYLYRNRPGSITNTDSLTNIQDRLLGRLKFSEFIESNIPSIFTHEELKHWRQQHLWILIKYYLNSYQQSITPQKYRDEISKQIKEMGMKTHMDQMRMKMAYCLICYFPWLLRASYPIYHMMREMIYRKAIHCT